MKREQIYQLLVVFMLAAVCSCNLLGNTTSEIQELQRQLSEIKTQLDAITVEAGTGGQRDSSLTGSVTGGATYTRWGRTTCESHSTVVYVGFVAKSPYHNSGGGVDYQCMVNDAEYISSRVVYAYGRLAGTEYQSYNYGVFSNGAHDQNAPCAVCYSTSRTTTLMVPGKRTCPTGWHEEYEGYLMSERDNHPSPSTYVCVDRYPEYIRGESANNDGGLLQFNRVECAQGVHCPEYDANKAITCVVCTK